MQTHKAPVLAKDAVYKLVDYGLPLERFKNDNTYLQFYKEREFLGRTSEFKPTKTPYIRDHANRYVRTLKLQSSDLITFDSDELRRLAYDDQETLREFELLDPLKGNSLVSVKYKHSILYLFSAGATLSQLVLSTTFLKPFEIKSEYTVQLPLDKLKVIDTLDLQYPIRQITFSPISSTVFIVRTTSSIHVFSLEDLVLKQRHRLFLPDATEVNSDIDHSMSIHVELSPYSLYQYLFITNNGYISLRDAAKNKILFESIDPFPESCNYGSRWKSCSIGATPSTLFIASAYTIQLWDISADSIKTNTLAKSYTRITAFATSKSKSIFCFATTKSLVFFDTFSPTKPFMTYKHHFGVGAPSFISIEKLDTDNWRTFLFSNQSQQLAILDFEYINTPSKSVTRKLAVKMVHNFTLSRNEFEKLANYTDIITSMGLNIKTLDKRDGREFISIERLFEDGSIRIQYIEISKETSKEELELITRPQYTIIPNPAFQEILEDAIVSSLPLFYDEKKYPETRNLKMDRINDYVEGVYTDTATNKLTDQEKTKVASKVRHLKYPTPFGKLFENTSFLSYDLNELETFLNQLEQYEDIEIIKQLNIPHLLKGRTSTDPELTAQLEYAHEKKIQLYSSIIRPLPEKYEPKTPLQYVTNEDVPYESNTTTKVFAHYWPVNSTSHKDLTFPIIDTTLVIPPETFPSASTTSRKRQASEDFGLPSITIEEDLSLPTILEVKKGKVKKGKTSQASSQQSQDFLEPPSPARSFTAVSTQPVPGAFGSRTKSVTKKKKKSKSSGFK